MVILPMPVFPLLKEKTAPGGEDPPGAKRYKQEKVRVKDVFN